MNNKSERNKPYPTQILSQLSEADRAKVLDYIEGVWERSYQAGRDDMRKAIAREQEAKQESK